MFVATVAFSLLYASTAKHSDLVAKESTMNFLKPSSATLATISSISDNGISITSNGDVYYCLVTKAFTKKLSGYGVSAPDYLSLSSASLLPQDTLLNATSTFMVMNYLKAKDEPLSKGKTYYLFLGTKDAEGNFTENNTECITIEP